MPQPRFVKKPQATSNQLPARKGFTMVEMIIVITIFTITAASTIPFLSVYKQRQNLVGITAELLQVFRRAQGRSLSGTNGLPWGVIVGQGEEEDTFKLFAEAPDLHPKYQEVHKVKRPFRICTNKPAPDSILFPLDFTVNDNESFYVEIYSEDDAEDRAFVLVNTTGTIEAVRTHTEFCHP